MSIARKRTPEQKARNNARTRERRKLAGAAFRAADNQRRKSERYRSRERARYAKRRAELAKVVEVVEHGQPRVLGPRPAPEPVGGELSFDLEIARQLARLSEPAL
jgi:hypothetical protein